MNIAFTGYYGFQNYGDDLFVAACAFASKKFWKKPNCSFVSTPLGGVQAKYVLPNMLQDTYSNLNLKGKITRSIASIYTILSNDIIVMAGGSTLTSGGITAIRKMQFMSAKYNMCKFAGIGVSIGPFSSRADEKLYEKFLQRFEYLSVRDQKSFDILSNMSLPYQPVLSRDLAGLIPNFVSIPAKKDQEIPSLAISLCDYESHIGGNIEVQQKRNKALFIAIREFAKKNKVTIKIYSLNNHPTLGDMRISRQLQSFLREEKIESQIIPANGNILQVFLDIASSTVVLSTRLHGAITAYLCGIPFTLVEYHTKCTDFLQDIGQREQYRIAGTIANSEEVLSVLEKLFNNAELPNLDHNQYIQESIDNFSNAPWCRI